MSHIEHLRAVLVGEETYDYGEERFYFSYAIREAFLGHSEYDRISSSTNVLQGNVTCEFLAPPLCIVKFTVSEAKKHAKAGTLREFLETEIALERMRHG